MLYTLSKLIKSYADRTVLDIPDLNIDAGKTYALLGPNGAGKTTLLNILGFLDRPDSGQLIFRSQPVRSSAQQMQALRKSVVVVDQHPILFTTTVFKNVEYGLKIRKIDRQQRRNIVKETLQIVGMGDFAQAAAHRLSGGETQRVALARALAVSPDVLLCDEPTSSVDVQNQQIILDVLRRINAEKKISVLFTTHDRSQAAALAHHTLYLEGGRLSSATFENVFTCRIENTAPATCRLSIGDRFQLKLPPGNFRDGLDPARIVIDPARINLLPVADQKNGMDAPVGRVTSVAEENGSVRLVVDAGVSIHVLKPIDEYRSNPITVGQTVQLQVSPTAVQPGPK